MFAPNSTEVQYAVQMWWELIFCCKLIEWDQTFAQWYATGARNWLGERRLANSEWAQLLVLLCQTGFRIVRIQVCFWLPRTNSCYHETTSLPCCRLSSLKCTVSCNTFQLVVSSLVLRSLCCQYLLPASKTKSSCTPLSFALFFVVFNAFFFRLH